jgi:integrase
MKLTKDTVAALTLAAGKSEHFVWDDTMPGFGVRLRGNGKRWVVQYRVNGQGRRESLGDVRKVTLEDARKIARQRFAKAELGIDPVAERERLNTVTLGTAVARYLDAKRDRVRPSTFRNDERYLGKLWKVLHGRPLDGIKRVEVAARLQEIVKDHGRRSAAVSRKSLSAMFAWAMKEGLAESNPVVATNDPAEGMQPRERVLGDAEIWALWNACADHDGDRIIKLLLLTGCRREEISALKWSELNLDTGLLTIPGTRTKNHRTLELPLPEAALDILRSVSRREDRDFVFGRFGTGFSGWVGTKWRLDAKITMMIGKPLAAWRIHDLRRTMRTNLSKLGVRSDVAERAINHVKGGMQAVYDRYPYQQEIADALALWANRVLFIAEGRSNIVPMQRA